MTWIEFTKVVTCPDGNRQVEVDNECSGCDHYQQEDEYKQSIECTFKKQRTKGGAR
jgi:hypothetical protein